MNKGNLLPDSLILRVIREHFMKAHSEGTDRFLLDGFPRTAQQAAALEQIADVKLAVNLGLREEVRGWGQRTTRGIRRQGCVGRRPAATPVLAAVQSER